SDTVVLGYRSIIDNARALPPAPPPDCPSQPPHWRLTAGPKFMRILALVAPVVFGATLLAFQQSAPQGDWPMHGRDAGETRYSPLKQINTGNVSKLALAWTY